MQTIETFVNFMNSLLWGHIVVPLLLGVGILFSILTNFAQFRHFGNALREIFNSRSTNDEGAITPFQAFATSVASRVGTGNIAGVAIAIYLGGAGAVFWMWLIALIGMATSLIETILGQAYKQLCPDAVYKGGPSFYIEKGLGKKGIAILFSIVTICAYLIINGVQSNTIASSVQEAWSIPPIATGLILALFIAPIIFGGIGKIVKMAEIIVPFMAMSYILLALGILIYYIDLVPMVFEQIIKGAFGIDEALSGTAGYALAVTIQNGVKRGLFSNEAGMGSSPNITSSADATHPVQQGLISCLSVFIDTILVCSATAFIILVSGVLEPNSGITGAVLTQNAITSLIGPIGKHFLAIAITLFSFTTIIACHSYAEINISYLTTAKKPKSIYRAMVLAFIVYSATAPLAQVWNMADMFIGMMTVINCLTILVLGKIAIVILNDYEIQKKQGIQNPIFEPSAFEILKTGIKSNKVWVDIAEKK